MFASNVPDFVCSWYDERGLVHNCTGIVWEKSLSCFVDSADSSTRYCKFWDNIPSTSTSSPPTSTPNPCPESELAVAISFAISIFYLSYKILTFIGGFLTYKFHFDNDFWDSVEYGINTMGIEVIWLRVWCQKCWRKLNRSQDLPPDEEEEEVNSIVNENASLIE